MSSPLLPAATLGLLGLAAACASRGPDVIFLPSAADVVARMLAVAAVRPDDVVYDLGCGDGRIVIAAAKAYAARGVCVDIDPSRVAASRRNADTAGVADRIEFRRADLFETDLGTASVVALYLSPALNRRLRPKLLREVRPGARIVSHNFDMGDWRPDTTVRVEWPSGTTSTVYGWVLPADVAGTWDVVVAAPSGERRFRVRFTQHYQEVSGTASAGGGEVAVREARLRGDRVEFVLVPPGDRSGTLHLSGRVAAAVMSGTLRAGPDSSGGTWRASRAP